MREGKLYVIPVIAVIAGCMLWQGTGLAEINVNHPDPDDFFLGYDIWDVDDCGCRGGRSCVCFTFFRSPERITAPIPGGEDQPFYDAFLREFNRVLPNGNVRSWTAVPGGELSGQLHVTQGGALVCDSVPEPAGTPHHCRHGAYLEMSYERGDDDPPIPVTHVRHGRYWLQYAEYSGFGCGYGPPDFPDPTFIDCPWDAALPKNPPPYYPFPWHVNPTEATRPTDFEDMPRAGCIYRPHNTTCNDPAYRLCPPCSWEINFETYLVYGPPGTVDPNAASAGVVTVFDGVRWGFEAGCVGGANPLGGPVAGRNPAVETHFDPATETLSFANCQLDVLNIDGSYAMDPAFADDPILDATISVSDFALLLDLDGSYIFEGGSLTIEKGGNTFLEAEMPWLYVDDEAAATFGENIYGEFGEVNFNLDLGSAWLAAYEEHYRETTDHPEFRAMTTTPIEPSIADSTQYDGEAYVWVAHCAPEPSTLVLAVLSGLCLLAFARRARKALAG